MITAQIESIAACWDELQPLFRQHHAELALYQDRMPLSPQTEVYFERERNGSLFLATIRWDGRIVGYQITFLTPGFHYSTTLTGTQDILWIVPEVRDRGLAFPLFRIVEKELRRRGASLWNCGMKHDNPLGLDRLLPKLGFSPSDSYFSRWIGK